MIFGVESSSVVLVGDSNVAAVFLEDSQIFGFKLTELSMDLGKCVDVDTFGVTEFGPDQALFSVDIITDQKSMMWCYFIFLLITNWVTLSGIIVLRRMGL